jgi:hypothetical protein
MRGDCQAWRNEIEESAAGAALSGGALAHLSACARCRVTHDESEKLGRLLSDLERIGPPPDFDFRLRARMARRGGRGRPVFSRRPYALGLAAAACLFAVCSLALLRATVPSPETPVDLQASGAATAEETAARLSGERERRPEHVTQTVTAGAPGGASAVASSTQARRRKPAAAPSAVRHTSGAAGGGRERGEAVFGSFSAPVRTASRASEESAAKQRLPLAIPVGNSDEPLRVLLRDESGAMRFVPTRSVSFGAQQIVARERGAQKVSYENQEGVW